MGKGKLKDPKVKKKIITSLAMGRSQDEIAKEVGMSQQAISKFKSREDIKPEIEKQIFRLAELADDAMDNIAEIVRDKVKGIPKDDHRRISQVADMSVQVLKGVNVLPSNVQNQTIINLFEQNNTISPQVLALIKGHNRSLEWEYKEDGSLKPGWTLDAKGNPVQITDFIDVSVHDISKSKE